MLKTKQLGVIGACILIGTALYLSPRTALVKSELHSQSNAPIFNNKEFVSQLTTVKSGLQDTELAQVERFEQLLNASSTKSEKIMWLDSLIIRWDQVMRPGIAAEYTVKKAELSQSTEDWKIAGKRYVDMVPFFSDQDKLLIGSKAIACLEEAKKLIGNDDESIETMLAIAQVQGTNDPMPGILKLRTLAEENPKNLEAQINLGFFSMQTAQYDKAIERFKKVLEIEKEYLAVRFYLSEAYLAKGEPSEAVKQLKLYINEVDPSEVAAIEEAQKRIKNIIN